MKNYTIVLVDRHPIVRAGIRGLFGTGSGIDVVGEASTFPEALALVQSKQLYSRSSQTSCVWA